MVITIKENEKLYTRTIVKEQFDGINKGLAFAVLLHLRQNDLLLTFVQLSYKTVNNFLIVS